MDSLDFLSSSPAFSIFQKKSNSIKFGGILFLIYILIMIFICLIYIADFIMNEKYDIQCSTAFRFRDKKNINDQRELNKVPNFPVNFFIDIYGDHYFFFDHDIHDFNLKTDKGGDINRGFEFDLSFFNITINLTNLDGAKYELIYKCKKENCSELFFDKENLYIGKEDFYIDNYASIPIQYRHNNFYYEIGGQLKNNKLLRMTVSWSYIIYKDLKGISRLFDRLFNVQNEYKTGYIYSYKYDYFERYYKDDNKTELVIAVIDNEINKRYITYERKEISLMDVLAKIGALFSTFHFVFITLFRFYENNFNNYKIINKIIQPYNLNNKINNIIKEEIKDIKKVKDIQKSDNAAIPLLTIKDNNEATENKETINIENIEDINGNKTENDNISDINEEKEIRTLPKISFFQYFFNNVYFGKCPKCRQQELINICNKIVLKYTSIDYILLNQMKLENLFKDYKWNDPSLNDIKNNELIIQLNNQI